LVWWVGGALHYHLKPRVNSSSIALTYWHQGIGKTHVQTILGSSYVFKTKKLFTAQIGLGRVVNKGSSYIKTFKRKEYPIMLLYSIGVFFLTENYNKERD